MSKTTILIVEDDAGLREALLDTLLLGNYEVVAADCAEEALMVLSSRPVDLVVSDIQMGEMSGLTLLKSIKAKYPNMPVLLMKNGSKILSLSLSGTPGPLSIMATCRR